MTVFFGKLPSRSVFSPLPVSTSIGCAPTASAARQVAHRVADARHPGHVDAEADADLLQHPGVRLAAFALRVRRVRTVEQRVDPAADQRQRPVHLLVDRVERRHVEQAAADARLVRRDDHAKARVVEPRDRLEAPRDRPPFVRRLDELGAVVVDHAVAVEHDELEGARGRDGFGGELDHVATRPASRCRRRGSSSPPRRAAAQGDWRGRPGRRP